MSGELEEAPRRDSFTQHPDGDGRLLEMGATRVDVGQSADVTWTVLADPEGNEFCVLSSRDR